MTTTFWICAIVFAVLIEVLFLIYTSVIYDCGWFGGIIISSIISCGTSAMILLIFLTCLEPHSYPIADKTVCQELVQASGDSKIEGTFYFRRGWINENDVYEYYYKDGNKIRKNYLYANNSSTYIVETSGTPHVELITRSRCEKWGWWRKTLFKEHIFRYRELGHQGVIYVPEGTIISGKFEGLNL